MDRQKDFINALKNKIKLSNILCFDGISSLCELYYGYITTDMHKIDYIKLCITYLRYGINDNSIVRVWRIVYVLFLIRF